MRARARQGVGGCATAVRALPCVTGRKCVGRVRKAGRDANRGDEESR